MKFPISNLKFAAALALAVALAFSLQPSALGYTTLLTDTDGTLKTPTNFWTANAARIQAATAGATVAKATNAVFAGSATNLISTNGATMKSTSNGFQISDGGLDILDILTASQVRTPTVDLRNGGVFMDSYTNSGLPSQVLQRLGDTGDLHANGTLWSYPQTNFPAAAITNPISAAQLPAVVVTNVNDFFPPLVGLATYTVGAQNSTKSAVAIGNRGMSRKGYTAPDYPINDFRCYWANYLNAGLGTQYPIPFTNDVNITASLEYPSNTFHQFTFRTFGGTTNCTMVGNVATNAFSDVLHGVTVPAGSNFWIRTSIQGFCQWNLPDVTWNDNIVSGFGNAKISGGYWEGTNVPDQTLTGVITNANTWAYTPIQITGHRADGSLILPPSILLRGDSITGNSFPVNYVTSAFSLAASTLSLPLSQLATAGNFAGAEITNVVNNQLAKNATVVINALGANDIAVQTHLPFATMTNILTTLWARDFYAGKSVYGWTITPHCNSPYTNAASINSLADNTNILALNTWIRSCPWPLSGYIDAARAVDPTDSGYWLPGVSLTGDGTHPNAQGVMFIFTNVLPVLTTIKAGGGVSGGNPNAITKSDVRALNLTNAANQFRGTFTGTLTATNAPFNGAALRYTNGLFYWGN